MRNAVWSTAVAPLVAAATEASALAAEGHAAAHGGGHQVNWVYVACLIINFAAVAILLFVLLWEPTVMTGLSAVIGSWKIMLI